MSHKESLWSLEDPRLDAFRKLHEVLPDLYGQDTSLRRHILEADVAEPFLMTSGSCGIAYTVEKDTIVAFANNSGKGEQWTVHITRLHERDGSNSEQITWQGPIKDGMAQPSTLFSFWDRNHSYSVPTDVETDSGHYKVFYNNNESYLYRECISGDGRFRSQHHYHPAASIFYNIDVPVQITPDIGIIEPQVPHL